MATTSALADRIRIQRQLAWPDFLLNVQGMVECLPGGCDGGDPLDAANWIQENNITADTCNLYRAEGTGYQCSAISLCRNCNYDLSSNGNSSVDAAQKDSTNPDCYAVPVEDAVSFGVDEVGMVQGEHSMMAEIYERGPIACGVDAGPLWSNGQDSWFFSPATRTGIFTNGSQAQQIDHEISVVGWGVGKQNGQEIPYWWIRNSWGSYGGINGFFRVERGTNQLGLESNACTWTTPIIPANLQNPNAKERWWMS